MALGLRASFPASVPPPSPDVTSLLFDEDVRARLTPESALESARRALIDAFQGRLEAPPRLHADLGADALVFTAGGYPDGARGVRIYESGQGSSDQVVLVWDGDGNPVVSSDQSWARGAPARLLPKGISGPASRLGRTAPPNCCP
jgi:hypothetical protein